MAKTNKLLEFFDIERSHAKSSKNYLQKKESGHPVNAFWLQVHAEGGFNREVVRTHT